MVAAVSGWPLLHRTTAARTRASAPPLAVPAVPAAWDRPAYPPPQVTLEALCEQWRIAFDAADSALRAARDLPADELGAGRSSWPPSARRRSTCSGPRPGPMA